MDAVSRLPGANAGSAPDQVPQQPVASTGPTFGALTLTDGTSRWLDARTSRRWAVLTGPEAGSTLYLSKTGLWILYTPAPQAVPTIFQPTIPLPPSLVAVTADQASAFLLRNHLELPTALNSNRTAKEI